MASTITIRSTIGATATTTCAGTANTLFVVGPPQSFTVSNFSANYPGKYQGVWILEKIIGVDGNPWYRWDADALIDNQNNIPTSYTATYVP